MHFLLDCLLAWLTYCMPLVVKHSRLHIHPASRGAKRHEWPQRRKVHLRASEAQLAQAKRSLISDNLGFWTVSFLRMCQDTHFSQVLMHVFGTNRALRHPASHPHRPSPPTPSSALGHPACQISPSTPGPKGAVKPLAAGLTAYNQCQPFSIRVQAYTSWLTDVDMAYLKTSHEARNSEALFEKHEHARERL